MQIHRGMLSEAGAEGTGYPPGTIVAVKVIHPPTVAVSHLQLPRF